MTENRFCSECGAPLTPGASFCKLCGKRVSTGKAAPPLAQNIAVAAESVCLVLPGANRHSGFLGTKVECFIIVFTPRRIIFALQTMEMMQANMYRARETADHQGKGWFNKWAAQFGANDGKQYLQASPQHILEENPGNFQIENHQLRGIRLREEIGDENSISTYTIEFSTGTQKHKFRFHSLNVKGWKKQFQEMYGAIVR